MTPTPSEREPQFKLSQDHVDLLSELNAHGAKYLLVGGYAVGAYSEPRSTKDLDLFILCSEDNSKAVFRALTSFGAPIAGFTPEDFRDPTTYYQMGVPPERVDILKTLSGVTFEEAWTNRVYGTVNRSVRVPVISYEDLVKNKTSAARPRDLLDVSDMARTRELMRRFYSQED